MNRKQARWFLLFVLIAVTTACASSPTPTAPTTPTIIDEPPWLGTLTPNGLQTLPFTSITSGQISVTIFGLSPNDDNTLRVGLAIGKWDGQACEWVITNKDAFQTTVLYATATTGGSVCASIFDANGSLTQPIDFDIRVTHP